MPKINVHYEVILDDDQFKKAVKLAEEGGYDYNDAGKVESITRLLAGEGTSGLPEEQFGHIGFKRIK